MKIVVSGSVTVPLFLLELLGLTRCELWPYYVSLSLNTFVWQRISGASGSESTPSNVEAAESSKQPLKRGEALRVILFNFCPFFFFNKKTFFHNKRNQSQRKEDEKSPKNKTKNREKKKKNNSKEGKQKLDPKSH